jgi:hypothetical protein
MTYRNRVTPFGEIVAIAARGTLMGNRGCLHDDFRKVVRTSARKDWKTCQLKWKGIRRKIMTPGKYTELFFLDEATSLAAGHRPCNDCRSDRLGTFQQAWARGVEGRSGGRTLVAKIDPVLHTDRVDTSGQQKRFSAKLETLPDGVVVRLPGDPEHAWLKWRGHLHRWSPTGYDTRASADAALDVEVLTPACTVKVLQAGYVPEIHRSVTVKLVTA